MLIRKLDAAHGHKVSVLEADGEIRNLGLEESFKNHGLTLHISAPYAQDQNGGAERVTAVIKTRYRAISVHSGIPALLWTEKMMSAIYIHNRLPSDTIGGVTPYPLVYKRKPSIGIFESSGRMERDNPRAEVGCLVGYGETTGVYRVWNPDTGAVQERRDADIDERTLFCKLADFSREPCKYAEHSPGHNILPISNALLRQATTNDDLAKAVKTGSLTFGPMVNSSQKVSKEQHQGPRPIHMNAAQGVLMAAVKWYPKKAKKIAKRRTFHNPKTLEEDNFKGRWRERHTHPIPMSEMPSTPAHYKESLTCWMADEWKEAREAHLQTHAKANSWDEIDSAKAAGDRVLDNKWVFFYKTDESGTYFKSCKARLTIRGDQQPKDPSAVLYAATLSSVSLRMILVLALRKDMSVTQWDVSNAFMNATLPRPIYMKMYAGGQKNRILRTKKAIFGLRESPSLWNALFTRIITELTDLRPVLEDPCLFASPDGQRFIVLWVDDWLEIHAKDLESTRMATEQVAAIRSVVECTGGGPLSLYLGVQYVRTQNYIRANQYAYIGTLLNKWGTYLQDGKRRVVACPMRNPRLPRNPADNGDLRLKNKYQQLLGELLRLSNNTRPDLKFSVSIASEHAANPGQTHHWAALLDILEYVQQSKDAFLTIEAKDTTLVPTFQVYSDASFADRLDLRSTQGQLIKFMSTVIFAKINKQTVVSTSTSEAELIAASSVCREAMWIRRIAKAMWVPIPPMLKTHCDNQQTIRAVTNTHAPQTSRMRHLDLANEWLRVEVQAKRIAVNYLPTSEMPADGLTKPLLDKEYTAFRQSLGVRIPGEAQVRGTRECGAGSEDEEMVDLG
ncbi:Copia protease [Ceratocystis lukuohia]|uniref:Copia protease n=1 Tax=Ceratocystis lukuohia TaxID=2019550 RepID=A0ABR4MGA5_9PEZI